MTLFPYKLEVIIAVLLAVVLIRNTSSHVFISEDVELTHTFEWQCNSSLVRLTIFYSAISQLIGYYETMIL